MAERLGKAELELSTNQKGLDEGLDAAKRKATNFVADVGASLGQLGRKMQTTGRELTAAVTLPIIGAAAAIVKVGADFDQTLNQIVGLTDVTRGELGGIRQEVLALSEATGRGPQELAEAFYFVASAGFTASEALDVLKTSAQASAAGLGQTQDVAKILGAAINAYGKENLSAARAADILVAAVKDGTAEADAFAAVLGNVIPTAASVGVSFDQVTAAIAGMTKSGVGVEESAVSLNQVLLSLLKPTQEAEQAMLDLGTSSSALRTELREKGLLATLRDLDERFGSNEQAASLVFGNVRALRGVLSLLNLDAADLAKTFDDTAGASGDLASGFAETEGPARELQRSWARMQSTLIDLSTDVLPLVVDLLDQIGHVIRGGMQWWHGLDKGQKDALLSAAALSAVLGPLLIVFGGLFRVIGLVSAAFTSKLAASAAAAVGHLAAIEVGAAGLTTTLGTLGLAALALIGILDALGNAKDDWDERQRDNPDDWYTNLQHAGATFLGLGDAADDFNSALDDLHRKADTGFSDLSDLQAEGERATRDFTDALNEEGYAAQRAGERMAGSLAPVRSEVVKTAGAYTSFGDTVSKKLKDALAAQVDYNTKALAALRQFRTDLESALSEAQTAQLDYSDTVLAIAEKNAELDALDKEHTKNLKTETQLQAQEYANRRAHILAELLALQFHMALIGDDIAKTTGIQSLLTSQEMQDGLTSKFPETKAAYQVLQSELLTKLEELATNGGPAAKDAADAIAAYLDPDNPLSPFRDASLWGAATIQAYIDGMKSMTAAKNREVFGVVNTLTKYFKASSPPGPASPLHFIDKWGERTALAWVDGLVGGLAGAVGGVRGTLSDVAGQLGRTMTPAPLAFAAAGVSSGLSGQRSARSLADASPGAAAALGAITLNVDARGAANPTQTGWAVRTAVHDALADVLLEQSHRYVGGEK